MLRRDYLEEEANADRWMISYADFITLLFAFFVVMYAISSVNQEKYRVLSDTLQKAFDTEVSSLDPIQIGEPTNAPSPHIVDVPETRGFVDTQVGNTEIVDPVEAVESLLGGFADQGGVSVSTSADWVEISVQAGLLFAPGAARLSSDAEALLVPALELLRATRHPVTIEGYTDNVTSSSTLYPSNWTLSAARSAGVAAFFASNGVRRERMTVVGYGENFPLETNATPAGRAQNRRVTIVVSRRQDAARNRNAEVAPLKAAVRSAEAAVEVAEPQRKADGGLIFSNTAPQAPSPEGNP